MADAICAWDGCSRKVYAQGFCTRCYRRAKRSGIIPPDRRTCRSCDRELKRSPGASRWPVWCAEHDPWAPKSKNSLCRVCGEPIPDTRARNAQYCSLDCRKAQERSRYISKEVTKQLVCVCGRPFESARVNARFCSPKCRRHAKYREGVPISSGKVCEEADCINSIDHMNPNTRYCSRICSGRARDRRKGVSADTRHFLTLVDEEALTATCSVCGPESAIHVRPRVTGRVVCAVVHARQRAYFKKRKRDTYEAETGQAYKPFVTPGRYDPKAARLRSKYGLSIAEFDRMVSDQKGRCAICETVPEPTQARVSGLVVDHNHATGAVRGLLCPSCNMGIGFLGDSPARLVSAAVYLGAFSAAGAA